MSKTTFKNYVAPIVSNHSLLVALNKILQHLHVGKKTEFSDDNISASQVMKQVSVLASKVNRNAADRLISKKVFAFPKKLYLATNTTLSPGATPDLISKNESAIVVRVGMKSALIATSYPLDYNNQRLYSAVGNNATIYPGFGKTMSYSMIFSRNVTNPTIKEVGNSVLVISYPTSVASIIDGIEVNTYTWEFSLSPTLTEKEYDLISEIMLRPSTGHSGNDVAIKANENTAASLAYAMLLTKSSKRSISQLSDEIPTNNINEVNSNKTEQKHIETRIKTRVIPKEIVSNDTIVEGINEHNYGVIELTIPAGTAPFMSNAPYVSGIGNSEFSKAMKSIKFTISDCDSVTPSSGIDSPTLLAYKLFGIEFLNPPKVLPANVIGIDYKLDEEITIEVISDDSSWLACYTEDELYDLGVRERINRYVVDVSTALDTGGDIIEEADLLLRSTTIKKLEVINKEAFRELERTNKVDNTTLYNIEEQR